MVHQSDTCSVIVFSLLVDKIDLGWRVWRCRAQRRGRLKGRPQKDRSLYPEGRCVLSFYRALEKKRQVPLRGDGREAGLFKGSGKVLMKLKG